MFEKDLGNMLKKRKQDREKIIWQDRICFDEKQEKYIYLEVWEFDASWIWSWCWSGNLIVDSIVVFQCVLLSSGKQILVNDGVVCGITVFSDA